MGESSLLKCKTYSFERPWIWIAKSTLISEGTMMTNLFSEQKIQISFLLFNGGIFEFAAQESDLAYFVGK